MKMTPPSNSLAVITPSYSPDFDLCSDLNESVLRNTSDSVKHYIIVPRRDLKLFSGLRGTRTEILSVDEILPRRILAVPASNYWFNFRRPFPPIRGWMMQQVIKLQMASYVDSDLLLLADSDVFLIQPISADTFRVGNRILFYRLDDGVHSEMERQLIWYNAACKMLGVPGGIPPLPDYTSPINVWERSTVLALQDKIHQTTGRNWLDVVASQLHFGEFTLYGVFIDKVLGTQSNVSSTDSMFCHTYWETEPLSLSEAKDFVQKMPASDVAIMISAKSGTHLDVRREALRKFIRNLHLLTY
jgi:hypothetical protein